MPKRRADSRKNSNRFTASETLSLIGEQGGPVSWRELIALTGADEPRAITQLRQMLKGLEQPQPRRRTSSKTPEGRRIRELEKELRRKDAALAETAALLVRKKKAQAIWGAAGDATPRRRGK